MKLEMSEKSEAPKQPQREVEDLLGQPLDTFDYKVFYTKLPSFNIPIESIMPEGWGDEFDDEKLLDKKETCTVEV